jgi:hypothetical protein
MTKATALLGTVFYLVWGALHIQAGIGVVHLGENLHEHAMVQGRIYQDAWTLLFAAAVVMAAALLSVWRAWKTCFWLNLGLASVTDIGFILFILVPGYAPPWLGIEGPLAWSLAVVFSSWSYLLTSRNPRRTPHRGRCSGSADGARALL